MLEVVRVHNHELERLVDLIYIMDSKWLSQTD